MKVEHGGLRVHNKVASIQFQCDSLLVLPVMRARGGSSGIALAVVPRARTELRVQVVELPRSPFVLRAVRCRGARVRVRVRLLRVHRERLRLRRVAAESLAMLLLRRAARARRRLGIGVGAALVSARRARARRRTAVVVELVCATAAVRRQSRRRGRRRRVGQREREVRDVERVAQQQVGRVLHGYGLLRVVHDDRRDRDVQAAPVAQLIRRHHLTGTERRGASERRLRHEHVGGHLEAVDLHVNAAALSAATAYTLRYNLYSSEQTRLVVELLEHMARPRRRSDAVITVVTTRTLGRL